MALAAGNIAFVGFNADGSDNLAFVVLADINPGEVIFFEDNEWNGTGWNDTNEGAFSWTTTSLVAAGTIVCIDNIGSGTIIASTGTATTPVPGRGTNRGIANSDEVIYAYQGTASSPTFITAIASGGFSAANGLLTNTGLTVGVNAIDLFAVDNDADVAEYIGIRSGQANFADYLAIINNPNNWVTQDGSGDQSADGIAPDIPFSATAFTVGAGIPTVNLSISSNTGSEAEQTVITVTATAASAVIGEQTVSLAVAGTGITSEDYSLSNTTITIPDGQTTGTVTFTIQDDSLLEGTETAILTLSNPSAGISLDSTISQDITILDNESGSIVNLSVSSNTGSEAGTTIITVTATTSSAVTGNQTVTLGVSGTDITTSDYYLTSNTIAIPDGQTSGSVTFIVADDAIAEGTETAILTINNPSPGLTLGDTTSQNIVITNNDTSFLTKVGSATSNTASEIPAFDPGSDRLYAVAASTVNIYTVSNTGSLTAIGSLDPGFTPPPGTTTAPNSVAIKNGIVAVAYEIKDTATNAHQVGRVSFFSAADGSFLNSVEVGALPDMLTFTPDGTKVLVANEGEPNSYGQANSLDPEGSVSIIDISGGAASATVQTAIFTSFNSQIDSLKASGVRITGLGSTVAQDLEPEYIAVSPDGSTARVTLQENNAIAILDLASATFTSIVPLGLKNHNLPGNGLDASDRDLNGSTGTINIQNWPVFGLYQPDAIASYTANGQTYYITANEGDARDYPGFSEEIRVGAGGYVLDPTIFPNASTLKQNANLGRLTVTSATGDTDGDGDFDLIEAFGARSFSIWDASGNQVFDSGDQLEQITAAKTPTLFNSEGTAASFDTRSDNKGPEPEGVVLGTINNRTYAFIGLERVGDVMVYDVTEPNQPQFIQYINTPEDRAVEGLIFVAAADSPTGKPLLITANEVSNTVAVFEITPPIYIRDIQGAGYISPLVGQQVQNVPGIVTAVASNGFYLQDPNPDNNEATSEGIFVFTGSAPTVQVGDSVTVTGTVTEFTPGANSSNPTNNLSITEITNPTVTVLSSNNPLPAAVILSNGGRIPPNTTIQSPFTLPDTFSASNLLLEEIQEVRPTNNTNASGSVSFSFDNATSTLTVSGSFSQLSGDLNPVNGISAAHIHAAPVGSNGPISFNLNVTANPDNRSGSFAGSFNLTPEQVNSLKAGNFYVNIHTATNSAGELRGQLFPNVAENAPFDPATDGQDFYESLEGMRVQVNNPLATSPTSTFGSSQEIWVLGDSGANATSRTARGGSLITAEDFNPERIQIDDLLDSLVLPEVKVGDRLSSVVGVVSYNFSNYEVLVSESPTVVQASSLEKETTNLVGTDSRVTLAAFNVENLPGNAPQSRFDAMAAAIVNNLKSPDIISLEEIQDNNGATNDGVVAADQTYQKLIEAIAAVGGPTYEYRQIDPVDGQDGGQPGGNIRVGFLFNPDRVQFVDRGDASVNRSTTGVTVNSANGSAQLSLSTGRIVDTDLSDGDSFNASRKPLVAEFTFNGQTLFLVGNHWNSKGGDQALFGRVQPPEQFTENQRRLQAQAVADLVTSLKIADPDANVVVMGDLNDFEFSQPLSIIEGAGMAALVETLPADERYTYNFEGNAQTLDHILVSDNLTAKAQYDVVHINSEFPAQISDHDPSVVSLDLPAVSPSFTLQLLHASDFEAGLEALDDAPRFSAVLNALKDDYANTLILSSGDNYIPGPFLFAGGDSSLASTPVGVPGIGHADIEILNQLGIQASAFGNHEFDLGTREVRDIIRPTGTYRGTVFPYLSANLNFSTDSNLSGQVTANGQEASSIPAGRIAETTVITVNGEKIGIVGATTPTLPSISSPGTVTVLPPNATDYDALAAEIQASVDQLTAAGINKVILLAHMQQLAIERDELAPRLRDVDIIVGGGSNTLLSDATDRLRLGDTSGGVYPILKNDADGKPVAVVNTDGNYKYVGRLVVEFDGSGSIIPSSIEPTISGAYATDDQGVTDVGGTPDPEIVEITDALGNVINTQDGNIFGRTEVFLRGDRTFVRTEETNLGNLTADANLAYTQQVDSTTLISLKNGGGIRSNIGAISASDGSTDPDDFELLPPPANPSAGKEEGDISQLDISNSVRFNNGLTLITVTAQQLLQVIEHGVAATAPGATPGQFPQISGIQFSFDPSRPASDRVLSLALVDENGSIQDVVAQNGELLGNPTRTFRLVTLNFLASGGDNYPFPSFVSANPSLANRVDILGETDSNGNGILDPNEDLNLNGKFDAPIAEPAGGVANFAPFGSEQDALAEYLADNFPSDSDPSTPVFNQPDVDPSEDTRIQNLSARSDSVLAGTMRGDASANTLVGGDGTDVILAGGGNDTAAGGLGNDLIYGEVGDDVLRGDANSRDSGGTLGGDDTIYGGEGNDRIGGKAGNDQLFGEAGDDQIWGDDGDDLLWGGLGNDTLTGDDFSGGTGADTFVLVKSEGTDTITDYGNGNDAILVIGTTDFNAVQAGSNTQIKSGEEILAILTNVNAADVVFALMSVSLF